MKRMKKILFESVGKMCDAIKLWKEEEEEEEEDIQILWEKHIIFSTFRSQARVHNVSNEQWIEWEAKCIHESHNNTKQ